MPWEIPRSDKKRFVHYHRHCRIAELECEIYDLPYKPLPFNYWDPYPGYD